MNDALEDFPLLSRLGPAERRALARELDELEVDAGTLLFDEGDPAEGLVLVAKGQVSLHSRRTGEAAQIGRGASLGAFSLAATGVREARAETTSRTRLLLLSREAYKRLAATAPRVACCLLESVVADTALLLRGGLTSVDRNGNSD